MIVDGPPARPDFLRGGRGAGVVDDEGLLREEIHFPVWPFQSGGDASKVGIVEFQTAPNPLERPRVAPHTLGLVVRNELRSLNKEQIVRIRNYSVHAAKAFILINREALQ